MKHATFSVWLIAAAALGGCTSEWDMQGADPKEYYAEHPVANAVETKYESHTVDFSGNGLGVDQRDALAAGLAGVNAQAVDSIQIQLHPSQMSNVQRRDSLKKALLHMGFAPGDILFEPSESMGRNQARIDVAYASVITPHCPDWRVSPVTSFSNTTQGNVGCSTVTNLGLMVADPRDLERGSGKVHPDADRNSAVLKKYRENSSSFSDDEGGSSATSATGAGTTSTSP